jgi:hypothetical protein
LKPGVSLESALHLTKLALLAKGNLIGLAYTPYALADLTVAFPEGEPLAPAA